MTKLDNQSSTTGRCQCVVTDDSSIQCIQTMQSAWQATCLRRDAVCHIAQQHLLASQHLKHDLNTPCTSWHTHCCHHGESQRHPHTHIFDALRRKHHPYMQQQEDNAADLPNQEPDDALPNPPKEPVYSQPKFLLQSTAVLLWWLLQRALHSQ
jgi:hypothetical protein